MLQGALEGNEGERAFREAGGLFERRRANAWALVEREVAAAAPKVAPVDESELAR